MDGDELLKGLPLASAALDSVRELALAAFVDKLTGLPNRAALETLHESYDRDVNARWTVVFIDLGGFKEINDTHGHPAGDAALQLVASQLANACRNLKGTAFRQGGDEFVVTIPQDRIHEFMATVERQITTMTLTMNKRVITVQTTQGYARGSDTVTLEKLIQRAEAACRVAKSRTDGKSVEWTEEIETEVPVSERRKCEACKATTTVLFLPSRKTDSCLTRCSNCGAEFASSSP